MADLMSLVGDTFGRSGGAVFDTSTYTDPHPPSLTAAVKADTRARSSWLMREVNVNMRHLSEMLYGVEPIAFLCECRTAGCNSVIWLSSAEFDRRAGGAAWIVLPGHETAAGMGPGARAA